MKKIFFSVFFISVLFFVSCGKPAQQEETVSKGWNKNRFIKDKETLKQIKKFKALPYLQGSRAARAQNGITFYNKALAQEGYNLYVSGHAPEAMLIDMEGELLHKWSYDVSEMLPPEKTPDWFKSKLVYWRRVRLYPNGDILAIYDGAGIIKLDKDSNLLWSYWRGEHHDFDVADNGNIYVLASNAQNIPWINSRRPVLADYILILDENGKKLDYMSILDSFRDSKYSSIIKDKIADWQSAPYDEGPLDILHTNTLEILDGAVDGPSEIFKKGNILISIRYLDTVAVIDPERRKVVWALSGKWHMQHQPTLLKNGDILVFDNLFYEDEKDSALNKSKVIEFKPLTGKVVWEYTGTPKAPFYTLSCGSNQRLSNGNTLITETDAGRAFEVTPEKRIVWEFINPNQTGKNNKLIASLFEVIRLPSDFPIGWVQNKD